MSYQGHLSDGSSIQKHSAGGVFPFVLIAKESLCFGRLWGVLRPGELDPGFWWTGPAAYDHAADEAAKLKDEHDNPPMSSQAQRCATCANSSKHLLHPKCGLCDGTSRYQRKES